MAAQRRAPPVKSKLGVNEGLFLTTRSRDLISEANRFSSLHEPGAGAVGSFEQYFGVSLVSLVSPSLRQRECTALNKNFRGCPTLLFEVGTQTYINFQLFFARL